MSKVVSRMKDLGQKAMALKAALDKAPAAVEGIRQTISATTDQIQQLRTEVRDSVTERKDDTGADLREAIRGLKASAALIRKAGFEVTGVDVETGLTPRLRVHLRRAARTPSTTSQPLFDATPGDTLAKALLGALEQTEAWLLEPPLESLEQDELLVTLGPIPSIRACWKAKALASGPEERTPSPSPLQTTFFAKRATPATSQAPLPVLEPPVAEPEPSKPQAQKWTQEALERFKKMPSGTKYGR